MEHRRRLPPPPASACRLGVGPCQRTPMPVCWLGLCQPSQQALAGGGGDAPLVLRCGSLALNITLGARAARVARA